MLAQQISYTELSPQLDVHGAIPARAACSFILNSAVHFDRRCSLALQFF